MLTATRLRNVLTTFETSNPFAKYLLQRITVFGCTFNKEYAALQLSPNVTSLSSIMTLLLKPLLPPETTSANTPRDSQTTGPVNETSIVLRNQAKHENLLTQATTTLSQAPSGTSNSTPSAGGTGSSQREFTDVNRIEVNQFEEQVKMSEINMKEAACTVIVPEQDSPKEGAVCNGSICGSVSEPHASGSDTKEKPCFKSSMADILRFMELVGNLKHTKRTGWVLRDVNDCESISGHMYRMSIMTFLLDGSEGLNQIRCMELALVHDLAESLVGDLTPFCGVAKEEKKAMELKAMEDICKLIEPRGKRIMELFEEYEAGKSAESKFVKDLDRLDMVMQAFEYEKRDDCLMKHQEFFDSTEGKFGHPFIKKLVEEINNQRKILVEAKSVSNGNIKLKTVTPNCPPCLEHKNERS